MSIREAGVFIGQSSTDAVSLIVTVRDVAESST
jgi:hypothetical protein